MRLAPIAMAPPLYHLITIGRQISFFVGSHRLIFDNHSLRWERAGANININLHSRPLSFGSVYLGVFVLGLEAVAAVWAFSRVLSL